MSPPVTQRSSMAGRLVPVAPSKLNMVNKRIRDLKTLVGKAFGKTVILSVTKSSRHEIFEHYGAISP